MYHDNVKFHPTYFDLFNPSTIREPTLYVHQGTDLYPGQPLYEFARLNNRIDFGTGITHVKTPTAGERLWTIEHIRLIIIENADQPTRCAIACTSKEGYNATTPILWESVRYGDVQSVEASNSLYGYDQMVSCFLIWVGFLNLGDRWWDGGWIQDGHGVGFHRHTKPNADFGS